MKNVKIVTRVTLAFALVTVLLILSLIAGYTTAQTIIGLPDSEQPGYLSSYAYFTAIIFVTVNAIIIWISIRIRKAMKSGIGEVTAATEAIAKGKVEIEIKRTENDEFKTIMTGIEAMADSIRETVEIAQKVADGDLTANVVLRSEEDELGHALRKLVTYTGSALGNIQDASNQVTVSASQVASASDALAQGSTEQASAIEEITASISDVAAKTKQNASQSNKAAEMMAETIAEVQAGNKEMKEMMEAMGDINRASESISKIIKVIDDIAFQTNILALNAAVEAARAGDAGKGFAVVAEEVRNLAAKSAAAAAETAEMIEDSIRKVAIGSKIAQETAASLDNITNTVQKSEKIITEIAESSNYQATAIAQIDQAIIQVSHVVQTNSATSEECAAASEELSNQAARVKEMVSVYKLKKNNKNVSIDNKPVYNDEKDDNEQIISLTDGFGKY